MRSSRKWVRGDSLRGFESHPRRRPDRFRGRASLSENTRADLSVRKVATVFLDVEVTVIEIDSDGDGSIDEELVIVEDLE